MAVNLGGVASGNRIVKDNLGYVTEVAGFGQQTANITHYLTDVGGFGTYTVEITPATPEVTVGLNGYWTNNYGATAFQIAGNAAVVSSRFFFSFRAVKT